MSDIRLDADRIGPTIDLTDLAIPEAVGQGLATFYGTDEAIRDVQQWVDANRERSRAIQGRLPTVEDLCTSTDGAHVFEARAGDERQAYVCVLDPLVYPILTDTPGTVRSETPVRGETITIEVGPDGVAVSNPDAVVSLGVSDHVTDEAGAALEAIYRQVCGYIHVFADEDEYETWADDVEARTTSVPVEDGVGFAMGLADALFEKGARRSNP